MKKLLSIILAITMLCSTAIVAFADDTTQKISSTSVPASKWAEDSIETARKINIISGNYNFPGAITREEFCGLIFSYIRNVAEILDLPAAAMPFTDTNNAQIGVLNLWGIIMKYMI